MDAFLGKTLVIGVLFVDNQERPVDRFETYGRIVHISDTKGIVIEKFDKSGLFRLPPDTDNLTPASPGRYQLKFSGMVVDNPDFTTFWTVENTRPEDIAKFKTTGFAAPGTDGTEG